MKKSFLLISHLIFWVFNALSVPYIFMWGILLITFFTQHPEPTGRYHSRHYEPDFLAVMIFITLGACIFYASYFSLRFFIKQPLRFIWIVFFYIVCSLVISLPADLFSQQAATMLGPVLYFNVFGFLFSACVEWLNDRRIKVEFEKDRQLSQLELLKTKIDPHFLFNNLNNIDIFIQEDPERASEYLRKLSDILRFMLYEAGIEKIPLTLEIEYINKYIDLQKIRTSNPSFVTFEISGDATNKRIAPMIFIHFIENAFKYAANKKIENAITISLDISDKNNLSFICKNHIAASKGPLNGGLGVGLLRQKLDLLYRKAYSLNTKEENNWYIVTLHIQLDED